MTLLIYCIAAGLLAQEAIQSVYSELVALLEAMDRYDALMRDMQD